MVCWSERDRESIRKVVVNKDVEFSRKRRMPTVPTESFDISEIKHYHEICQFDGITSNIFKKLRKKAEKLFRFLL